MQLLNLPTVDGNKFLIVNEGTDAAYAENLTIAWLQTIRKNNPAQSVAVLLFSQPKQYLDKSLKSSGLTDIEIKDYFSISCQTDKIDVLQEISSFIVQHAHSILVINCVNTLALQIGTAKALRFVEKLRQNHKSQVFCIYRRDFCQSIPRIETLGNTYVALKKSKKTVSETDIHYEVAITHRKPGGSVIHSNELVYQSIANYNLRSEKIVVDVTPKLEQNKVTEIKLKPEASFRIEMSEKEIKQRDSVPLPYILSSKPSNGESKIIYVPDDVDDLDEEDPDDDLDF